MIREQKRYTTAEYLAIAALPENALKRLELVNGVIVEMAPSNRRNTVLAGLFVMYLNLFVREHDLGYITVPDGGFQLDSETLLMPDAAFIAKTRVIDLEGVTFVGAPDLAVEVSPSESSRKALDKAQRYLQAGGKLVWNAYAEEQVVDVIRLAAPGSSDLLVKKVALDEDGVLDGADVLPGFTLPLRDLFKGLE